jgi:cellulose synthase/poly-beta-1,6-N-acetylglucosamine synthase-like glycosyltransferase
LQIATAFSKQWLIESLRKHGIADVAPLQAPGVDEQNFIFALRRYKYVVQDDFFKELANTLGLPFIQGDRIERKSDLAITLPYTILHENLIVPLELSDGRLKIATANPLNIQFFKVLEEIFRAEVEVYVAPTDAIERAIGRGYREMHRHRALRDLRYRRPDESAYLVLYPWQRYVIIGSSLLVAVLFVLNYPLSFIVVFAAINLVYFCVNPIKFYIAFRAFKGSRRSVKVTDEDLRKIDDRSLPEYTILIPVYREAKVLPHIVENVCKLDYPRDKLDVKILMEERDEETIREAQRLGLFGKPETVLARIIKLEPEDARQETLSLVPCMRVIDSEATTIGTLEGVVAQNGLGEILRVRCKSGEVIEIPEAFVDFANDVIILRGTLRDLKAQYLNSLSVFDAVVVPDAEIRTKPRACNYGLLRAKGEYCVIYDAEDDPEPDQLKKAVIAFSRAGRDCVCLQSRLNFYNPKDNLLTRWFSLEYSFWYDYYLEGLDHVGAPLPLGGTSNHFRVKELRELGGWDPYNVTEDADLGVRISRRKLKTAMLNTYTYEEANKELPNWIRQRSRWCKGYLQTYLVHMRHPRKLIQEMGWKQFLYFQLTFGGNIFLPLANPILYAVTLLTLLMPEMFQFLFFYPIVYVCIFNLVAGNALYVLLHMGPYVLRKHYTSIPLALIIPVYWMLISLGDWRGTIQLITKPFYWEKTQHGLSHIYGKLQA